jgi:hypothetical protein
MAQRKDLTLKTIDMKKIVLSLLIISAQTIVAQGLTIGNEGGNKRASVSEQIGLAKITVDYHRPGVKGREGKIWNTPVAHYGLVDMGFGSSTQSPWRAGANENTTMTFSEDVTIEGKPLAAGTYGFHIILGDAEDILIFSKRNNSWGSFYYDPAEDALRVPIRHKTLEQSVEWLKYEFTDQTDSTATLQLVWENRAFPFKIGADVNKIQMAHFKSELKTKPGFNWQSFVQAVNYCLQHQVDYGQALAWADEAITARYVGQKNFRTLSTKAMVLEKLDRKAEAEKVMADALPLGSMIELHGYGRQLIASKEPKKALEVFRLNAKNNPNVFTTNVGLARGYSANGRYAKALSYLKKARPQAPDTLNKNSVASMITLLESGKDIN